MDKLIILCCAVFVFGLVAGAGHENHDENDGHGEGHMDVSHADDDHEETMCMRELRECKESYDMMTENSPNRIDEILRNLYTYKGCVEKVECYDSHDAKRKENTLLNIGIDIETTPGITTCAERIKECWLVFEERSERDFTGFINCMKAVKERTDVCSKDSMQVVITLVEVSENFLNHLVKQNLCPGCTDTVCADGLEQCRQTFVSGHRDEMELDLVQTFHDCVEGVMCTENEQIHRDNLREVMESMLIWAGKALNESPNCDPSIEGCRQTYMEQGQSLEGTRAFKKCVSEAFCPGERGIAGKIQLLLDIREKIQGFKVYAHGSVVKPALVTMTLALVLALFFK